jgi:protein-S-isoprenylcysteine O-methyltransferase Ste14
MYFGGVLGTIAFGLIFRSTAVMLLALVVFFAVFRRRWMREEEILEMQFGEQYREYKKRTKRLIPGIY